MKKILLVYQEWEKMKVGNSKSFFSAQFFMLCSRMRSRLPRLTTPVT